MSKPKKDIIAIADAFVSSVKNLLNPSTAVNFDFTDSDGNVLFSTEADDDALEVGMAASPDGTFELPDGRTVTIAEGVIAEIAEPSPEAEELENLRSQVAELTAALQEAQTVVTDLRNQVRTTYAARGRMNGPAPKAADIVKTAAEKKAEAKEKINQFRKGGVTK
jgi:hypothetical protein